MKPIEWIKLNLKLSHNEARKAILDGRVLVDGVKLNDYLARDVHTITVDGKDYKIKGEEKPKIKEKAETAAVAEEHEEETQKAGKKKTTKKSGW